MTASSRSMVSIICLIRPANEVSSGLTAVSTYHTNPKRLSIPPHVIAILTCLIRLDCIPFVPPNPSIPTLFIIELSLPIVPLKYRCHSSHSNTVSLLVVLVCSVCVSHCHMRPNNTSPSSHLTQLGLLLQVVHSHPPRT